MRKLFVSTLLVVIGALPSSGAAVSSPEIRSLDGSGNNVLHPTWGQAGTQYLRVAPANYANGIGAMVDAPPVRYISNRTFNDTSQNVFSENGISQWGWLWGQFLDHTFGLRDETPGESATISFDATDALEGFTNDFGAIGFARTPAAPGTGVTSTRQQINTVSSYIDAFAVYGGSNSRLEWLRRGPVNGDMSDNKATLLLTNNYLPRVGARGDASTAPPMDFMGMLAADSSKAVVAGDVRANENIALTAVHTLMAREHNRIVAALPSTLSEEEKFQIARRVVGAEEQYITYTEFLPSLGVQLAPYHGYDATVNASLSNEFAAVGYRAHSMIHGEMEPVASSSRYTQAQLDAFTAQGITVEPDAATNTVKLVIPLNVAFGNPTLLPAVGIGPLLKGLGNEVEYRNDEQIDDSLRSVLFQVPKPGIPDPSVCGEPIVNADCYTGVVDLGAIDVQRGRDHGMPYYNDLRRAYGLAPKTTFAAITGEASDSFPTDPALNAADPINDPKNLDFTQLRDRIGSVIRPSNENRNEVVISALRRTPLGARLKAIYGDVNKVDAFTGMVSEPHVFGTEFGELQLAMWKKQFEALRDGDRFFYANDPYLKTIKQLYGIDFRHTLADVIQTNTGVSVQPNVFEVPLPQAEATPQLVGAYGFNEGAGSRVGDASGRGNNGSTVNTTWIPNGKFGSALSFNGRSSFVTVQDAGSLDLASGMTLEGWVNPTALGTSWRNVVFKERTPGMGYALYANDDSGRPIGQVQIGGEQNAVGQDSLPLNTWTHLAVTYDGTTEKLYVDGELVGSNPQTGSIEVSSGTLTMGGDAVWPEWFRGAIDEVRVYDGPLTQEEIQDDMGTPIGAAAPPLPPVLTGDQQVEIDTNPEPADRPEAFPNTASRSGTLRNVTIYVDATSDAPSLVAGVYSDNGGHPGTLLTQGTLSGPAAGTWNSVAVPPLPLAAGTKYWIAVLGPDGGLVVRDRCCSVTGDRPTETNGDQTTSLPAEWSRGTVYDDGPISAFGSG